jgi:ATP synthase F1 complex assembly factor 2
LPALLLPSYAEEGKSNALTRLQEAHWTPLIKWAEKHFNTQINVAAGQLFNQQPKETVEKLTSVIKGYDAFRLAGEYQLQQFTLVYIKYTDMFYWTFLTGFERTVMASKSYLIALGLAEGYLTVEEAAKQHTSKCKVR